MQKKNHSCTCTSKMRKPPKLANSVMAPYFFIYTNRNKAEPRKVTKQVVWIILRNRICHGTIRHIRSGFSLYARTLCALTLIAYALKIGTTKCNLCTNQRTNGHVNAHLISWLLKHKTYTTWKIYGKEMTLTFNTHIPSKK